MLTLVIRLCAAPLWTSGEKNVVTDACQERKVTRAPLGARRNSLSLLAERSAPKPVHCMLRSWV